MKSIDVAYSAKDLGFTYKSAELSFTALQDVNFNIQQGEFVAITGASGSGKSTLMNMMGLLAKPTEGDLTIAGQGIKSLSDEDLAELRNKKIGFVFQQFHLLPRLSVMENVLLPIHYMEPRPNAERIHELKHRAEALLKSLGVFEQMHKLPALLSGGQKQRVAIARALLCDPEIILADEPTGALDSASSDEVLRIFSDLHRQGRTIIVITHDPEVMQVAQRNIVLKDGLLLKDEAVQNRRELLSSSQFVPPSLVQAESMTWLRRGLERIKMTVRPWTAVLQSLASAKLRTFLTSLGLIIGVCSIIIMLTVGKAAQDVILKIFHQVGTDRVYLGLDYWKIRTSGQYAGYWDGLDVKRDVPAIQAVFANHAEIVPLVGWGVERIVGSGGATFDAPLTGVYSLSDLLDKGAVLDKGRFFAPEEFESASRVTVVSSDFTDKLFPRHHPGREQNPNFPIGEIINTRGRLYTSLEIVGVLKPRDSLGDSEANDNIYVPVSTYMKASNNLKVTWIAAKPKEGVSQRWLADSLTNYLTLQTNQRYPFRSEVPEETVNKIMLFISVFQGLTTLIGALCILVGGIGIMNIMLVTIAERVREIGLRKALGAKKKDITWQFLMECLLLCFISGLVGLGVGLGFSNIVGMIAHVFLPDKVPSQFIFSMTAVILGIGTALACGLLFGMMPAMKASKLDPSDALRSE